MPSLGSNIPLSPRTRKNHPVITVVLTTSVSDSPANLPRMNSKRWTGFARRVCTVRRSISRLTSPMPMNTEVRTPNTSIDARPKSLMIFSSLPTVRSDRTCAKEIIATAKTSSR